MAVEGTLDLFRLPEILQMISQQNKTGILTVQGQQDIVAVSFLNGRIVAVDALTETVEDGLSEVLVDEGLVSSAEFSRVAAENQAAGGRLLDVLVERGLVSREELLAALRVQTRRQLEKLLRWDQGDFKFYSGDEVSYEEGFEPIVVEDLLLQSLGDFAGASEPEDMSGLAALGEPEAAPAGPFEVPPRAVPLPAAASWPVSQTSPGRPAARGERGEAAQAPAAWSMNIPDLPGIDLPAQVSPRERLRAIPPPAGSRAAPAASGQRSLPGEPQPSAASGPRPVRRDRAPLSVVPCPAASPAAAEAALPKRFRKMEIEHPESAVGKPQRVAALALAAGLAAGLFVVPLLRPLSLAAPFPWQGSERSSVAQQQRLSLYQKIGRAAKTFFLLAGHFPDRLSQLTTAGLLSPLDLQDPQRSPLLYTPREDGYTLQPSEAGKPVSGLETTEGVNGNFLLDPALLVPASSSTPPVVLLD